MERKKLEKLTWKYFLEQKWEECQFFIGLGIAIVLIPYFTAKIVFLISPSLIYIMFVEGGASDVFSVWVIGVIINFLICFVIVVMKIIINGLNSNWQKAKERAKKKLKGGKQK